MAEASNTTVTLQVHRFTPRPERAERARGGSPFAKKGSPFGGGSDSAARRRPRGKQWVQEYTIPARPSDTVLDCLLTIKRTVDPTLAFRYSCGHGMCGSDAVAINGTPTCCAQPPSAIGPSNPAPCPKSMTKGSDTPAPRLRNPTIPRKTSQTRRPPRTQPQTVRWESSNWRPCPASRRSATSSPTSTYAQPDQEAHPVSSGGRRARHHRRRQGGRVRIPAEPRTTRQIRAAEQLHRLRRVRRRLPGVRRRRRLHRPGRADLGLPFVNDSRDTKAMERMDAIDTADGVAACQSVRACSRHCPRGIDVGEEMWQIVAKVRER